MKNVTKIKYFPLLIIILVIFTSIGYASVSGTFVNVKGKANVKDYDGVYIVDYELEDDFESDNDNDSIGEAKFIGQTTMKTKIELTNSNTSFITYSIMLHNNSSDAYVFDGVKYIEGQDTYDNTNITFDLIGLTIGDQINSKDSITFKIVFHYKDYTYIDNNVLNAYLNFDFIIPEENLTYEVIDKTTGGIVESEETFRVFAYDVFFGSSTKESTDIIIYNDYNANEYYAGVTNLTEPKKVLVSNNFYTHHDRINSVTKMGIDLLDITAGELSNYSVNIHSSSGYITVDFLISTFVINGESLKVPSFKYYSYNLNGALVGSTPAYPVWLYDEDNKTFILSTEDTFIEKNMKFYIDRSNVLLNAVNNS